MRVYPKPGVLIRDPVKRDLIPETGRDVGDGDPYWIRRILDEDATTTPPAAAAPPPRSSGKGAPATTEPANGSNDA